MTVAKIQSNPWPALLTIVLLFPAVALADNVVHPSTPLFDRPTLTALGIQLPITGDDNFNAKITVRYRKSGTTSWYGALPLFRVHPESVAGYTVIPQFAGSIFDLRPATSYDVELHLTDPDGPVDTTFTLTGSTRPVPKDPVTPHIVSVQDSNSLSAALNAAKPGDIITLANGTYPGAFSLYASGTATNPIVIRGVSQDGVVLDAGGCTGCNVLEAYGSWVHIENLTLQNAVQGLRFQTAGAQGNVVRRVHIKNTTIGMGARDNQLDFYIADNILEGRLAWPLNAYDDNLAHTDDEGIIIMGQGHVVVHNRISGYSSAVNNYQTGARAFDVNNNEVLWTYNCGVKFSFGEGNIRALRNRYTNVFMGMAVQPVYGGPAYFIRNVVVNSVSEQMKFHASAGPVLQEPNGVFAYNNTFVSPYNALNLQTGALSHHFAIENNLFVGPLSESRGVTVDWEGFIDDGLFDYNGYFPDGVFAFNRVGLPKLNVPNFASMQAAAWEPHGVLLNEPIFASGLVGPVTHVPLLLPQDVSLASNSPALDKGLVLPNISDAYSGRAPDLGALESGCPAPIYGPRPDGIDETNEPFGCPGPAQTTVPNVVGLTQAQANSAITGAGLVLGTLTQVSSSTVPSGSVISQNPISGSPANPGSAVSLVISTGPAGSTGGTASFIKTDGVTQGTWKGVYGADGYTIVNDSSTVPAYVTMTPAGNGAYSWAPSTGDSRALQKGASSTDRIASCWFSAASLTIDLAFKDANTHQVALYNLDWDGLGRTQRVDILDASNNVLDSRSISGFAGGQYLVWNLSGHVIMRIINTNPTLNAVIGGLFFGTGGSGSSGSAAFVKTDSSTSGTWKGVYGADGYTIVNDSSTVPAYVTMTPAGNGAYSWAPSTGDSRALQKGASSTDRIASCWFSAASLTIDLAFKDTNTHQVALYNLDWDGLGRTQRVDILDASNNILDSRSISGFAGGQYLVWNLSGHVIVRITNTNPTLNAVIGGLFFGTGSSGSSGAAAFVKTDSSTSGTWKGVYGADGYNVMNDAVSYPAYVSVSPSGNAAWTWSPATSDVRATQKVSAGDRIAACWYSSDSFTVDLNFKDSNTHQVALYMLDWDTWAGGRTQRIDILDANNNLLDSRSISSFTGGQYAIWNLRGHVIIRFTNTNSSANAVLSGIFFK